MIVQLYGPTAVDTYSDVHRVVIKRDTCLRPYGIAFLHQGKWIESTLAYSLHGISEVEATREHEA